LSVVLSAGFDSIFLSISQEIGWEERRQNDLFYVKRAVKP